MSSRTSKPKRSPIQRRQACAVILLACVASVSPNTGAAQVVNWTLEYEGDVRLGEFTQPFVGPAVSMAVGPDGRVFLRPGRVDILLEIDSLEVAGERGPFAELGGFGWLGDRLYAIDKELHRITFYDSAGDVVLVRETEAVPMPDPFEPNIASHVLSDSTLLVVPSLHFDEIYGGFQSRVPLVRAGYRGESPMGIGVINAGTAMIALSVQGKSISATLNRLADGLNHRDLWRLSADRQQIVIVDPTINPGQPDQSYQITVVTTTSGDTVRSRLFDFRPVNVPQSLVDSVVSSATRLISRQLPNGIDADSIVRSVLSIPATYPPFSKMMMGTDGVVWLRNIPEVGDTAVWTVMSADLEMVAWAAVPSALDLVGAHGEVVWAIWQNRGGPMRLSRFRIRSSAKVQTRW